MVASGNDFVVVNRLSGLSAYPLKKIAKNICDRKYGVGADGLLVLEKSKKADVRMRIFNPDGSEVQMCGNGARCVALLESQSRKTAKPQVKIETRAGMIDSQVKENNVKIRLTDPKNIKLDIPVKLGGRQIKVNFINTGVPHAVVLTEGLKKMDIVPLGRALRYHKKFLPAGTNVDFVEALSHDSIRVRTYERGVEDETLACGTGSVASSLIFALKTGAADKVYAHTRGQEILSVYFTKLADKIKNVWLEGKSKVIYEGAYYV